MRKLPIYGLTAAGCYSLSAGSEWTLEKKRTSECQRQLLPLYCQLGVLPPFVKKPIAFSFGDGINARLRGAFDVPVATRVFDIDHFGHLLQNANIVFPNALLGRSYFPGMNGANLAPE